MSGSPHLISGAKRHRRRWIVVVVFLLVPQLALLYAISTVGAGPRTEDELGSSNRTQVRPTTQNRITTGRGGTASEPLQAAARFEGVPVPGGSIRLLADASSDLNLRYRWVQVGGPTASIDNDRTREAMIRIPSDAERLEFLLVVSNENNVHIDKIKIPIQQSVDSGEELIADAGDDQIGVVGRQMTLNGHRSSPQGEIGYRWVQVGGPAVRLKIEDNQTYTFVPEAPGLYRFALVVAKGSMISDPSLVSVTVKPMTQDEESSGQAEAVKRVAASSVPRRSPIPELEPLPKPRKTIEELVMTSVQAIPGSKEQAGELADVFDEIVIRMSLYPSFSSLMNTLSQWIDRVIETASSNRAVWTRKLFEPLTARLIEEMRAEGLDLRRLEAHSATLSDDQRARLAEIFEQVANALRSEDPMPTTR